MLSSRYLHLHEALGLGPMWLNREAKVRPNAQPAPAPTQAAAKPVAPPTAASPVAQAVRTLSAGAHQARQAAMAVLQHEKTAAPIAPATPEAAPVRPQNPLSDGIMPQLNIEVMPSEIMVVSICPSPEDSLSGQLFSGSVGVLLDNMLAAIGLKANQAHKTCWVKHAPVFNPSPEPSHMQAELPQLAQELAQSQAKAVLFLGQIFNDAEHAELIAQLCPNTPHFIIPHPARLLRQPQLKAQAWQELKKLKKIIG